ncbi:thiamine pyrophosphate-binding protein [Frigidibacter sp. ROC022]|uniref:thiamine pyrophosphate-binding protein n=1 Tax=Frigidibacter sp. ROC022 TaxID=2971796 RepID=UPI00215B22B4|nr:thiamine pyrophosphate-binding protein [Frigidibacter sp. ROC022]MCR8726508.1 thiamine pyrophosphate-binding protein [Frigidibacter sp. ROC022]
MRHGGQILVDQLKLHGVERVFSVPGESFLAALDGLYESGIENVVCRQEGGATMMAEAMGKLTGRPGVAFVTRGPGATNASSGVHVARQDSTPMVLFIGQIARSHRDREAFQEVDFRAMFGPLAKWAAEIDDPARIPEYVNRAFHVASSGRPGPVVLSLPEDMLAELSDVPALAPTAPTRAAAAEADLARLAEALQGAKRPLVIAGGSGWSQQAADDLGRFAEAAGLPVAVSFRRLGHFDNTSANYVGDLAVGMNPKLGQRLRDADLLLVLGSRLADIATNGYELIDPAAPGKTILHVHPDPDLPGQVYRTDLAITADAPGVIARLAGMNWAPGPWAEWTAAARADYEAWQVPQETPGAVRMEEIVCWLRDQLPPEAILTNGAGNYAGYVNRYWRFRRHGTMLAPTSGSMGYGFPASIAAKLLYPDRPVVCFAGDGCFQMTLNEMSTAVQHGANVITIVANNGQYGTIRAHQERSYPARVSGTILANPDYAALARAYGGHGETVERTEDFATAWQRAVASGRMAVIELRLDPEALAPGQTLSEAREVGRRKQAAAQG